MAIRKFRKRMKPFILIITIVFLLSLAFGGYQSFQTSRANKKAQEAFSIDGKVINKIEIERQKHRISDMYQRNGKRQVEKELVDILAFNQVVEKELGLKLAKNLKIKVPSSEINKEFESVEAAIGDKAQFKRMLEFQGLTKQSYKDNIEKELIHKKIIEYFMKEVKPTEQEIKYYYAFNIRDKSKSLEEIKEKIIGAIQTIEGSKNYQEAIGKMKKEAKIEEVSEEYKNLVEKVIYEEKGFKISNLDFALEELSQNLKLGKIESNEKQESEKTVKEIISKKIRMANLAKSKGISISKNLSFVQQIREYQTELLKKYREEIQVDTKELKQFFEQNKERYRIEASADANIAFVKVKSSLEDEKIAKIKAEEVLKEVTKDNFDKKGKEFSEKRGYIFENLGTFGKGTMVKEFEEAVKNTPSMTIAKKLVKTGFGYHIVFVKENNSKEAKWTVSHILVRIEPTEKTINEKLKKLEKIKMDLEKGTINFKELPKLDDNIVQNITIDGITPNGNIPNIGYNKEITNRIFSSELNRVEIIQNNSMFILFQKTKEIKSQKADFSKLENRIKNDFINYKALQKMMQKF